MRRLTGLVMAIVLVCGLVLSCVPFTSAAGSSMVTSDAAVQVIKTFEGFLKYPVWDCFFQRSVVKYQRYDVWR